MGASKTSGTFDPLTGIGIWDMNQSGKTIRKMKEANNKREDVPEYYIVTDVLDLHGFFPEQVPEIVDEFIKNARSLNLNRLRIIHGKGKSKLKYMVRKELEKNEHVADFGDASPEIGGWGATIVILKEGS